MGLDVICVTYNTDSSYKSLDIGIDSRDSKKLYDSVVYDEIKILCLRITVICHYEFISVCM